MDIQLTEEQELLRSSVQRLLRDQYDFDARRKIVASEDGFSRKQWEAFAELGLLGAPFSEDVGGLGGGPLSTMIIMQEFGRQLVVEPFVETVVIAGGLIEHTGSDEAEAGVDPRHHRRQDDLGAGLDREGLALRSSPNVGTTARRDGKDYVLNGEKTAVIAAPWADYLIVSARTSGHRQRSWRRQPVRGRSPRRQSRPAELQDHRRPPRCRNQPAATFVRQLLGKEGEGVAALEACRDRAIGALCAEAVGAMAELNAATLEYSKTRKQFGTTIGSFQVLQHRMVDMFIAHQEALSLMQHLRLSLDAQRSRSLAAGVRRQVEDRLCRPGSLPTRRCSSTAAWA